MVLVEGPMQAPGFAVGQGDVDSEALTQDRIDAPVLGSISPSAENWASDQLLEEAIAAQAERVSIPDDVIGAIDGGVPPLPVNTGESTSEWNPVHAADGSPLLEASDGVAPVAWQSESSAKIRQLATVAVVGVFGLLLASTTFFVIVRQWSKTRNQQADASANTVATDPSAAENDAVEGSENLGSGNPESGGQVPEEDQSVTSTNLDATDTDPSDADEATGEATVDNEPAGAMVESAAGQPKDPLFPEVVMGGGVGGQNAVADADAETTAESLPPSLAQYMQVIVETKPDAAIPKSTEAAPAAIDQLKVQFPQMMVAETEFPPPAAPIDVRRRGEMRIIGLKAEQQALGHLIRVVGQAAGIPVQLELMSFDVVGRDVDTKISVTAKETQAAPLLGMIAQNAGCIMQLGDDGIVSVLPAEGEVAAAVARATALADFGGTLPLSEVEFQRLIGAEETVGISVRGGRVVVEGDAELSLRSALAMEAIRVARGLQRQLDPPRTGRWIRDVSRKSDSDSGAGADWSPIANHPVGMNEDHEYGLELVLGDLAADAGAALVLDWRSCWTHGLTPDAKALPWYTGKKTHEVFQQVLRPFALQAFDVGTNVIWVGTQETYEQMKLWGVFSAGPVPNDAVTRIALAVGQPVDETAAWLDQTSGKVVACLPRYILRQLPDPLTATQSN